MSLGKLNTFLEQLGFSERDFSRKGDALTYSLGIKEIGDKENVSFVFTAKTEDIFKIHQKFWNKNDINYFIAVSENKTYIINAKVKPDSKNPVSKDATIKSFDYGVNTPTFENEKLKEITKDYIDSTYFFDFIIKQTAKKKKQEVDKHLLLNLIKLRNDLKAINNDDEKIHLLILHCLFIKYLEDKEIYDKDYLISALSSENVTLLINKFNEIKKINGDIFDEQSQQTIIDSRYLKHLHRFFTSDYRTGQQSLFPYLFDQIPIQLISHVYEAFLKSEEKRGKGIYYTPAFVVNFMLSHSLIEKLKNNSEITVLDPAVGSGAFLVESFRAIIKNHPQPQSISYKEKKAILENQLFGIDIDHKALQIAAFSLYLALIETEKPEFIREEIINSHPILPTLIGKTLIHKNAITDDVFSGKTFDCIISNPPWGSVEPNDDEENKKERKSIGIKGKSGTMPEYTNVSDYERSQAFLIRVKNWSHENTNFTLIVKNSIFLNDNSENFRKELLNIYQINYFYELSNYNKILFKKQKIGDIDGKAVEIGASEPCVVLVFELFKNKNNIIQYISPKLNGFAENFQLIHYTEKDINKVEQSKFIEDDLLWRVLVNGDFEDYKLIQRIFELKSEHEILCSKGFEPQRTDSQGELSLRKMIKSEDFERWFINGNFTDFNWNQKLRRKGKEELFCGERILIANRPRPTDNFKLRCVVVDENLIYRNDIVGFKVLSFASQYPFAAILNSKLTGYFMFNNSAQWFGGLKRDYIRLEDIKTFPFLVNDFFGEKTTNLIKNITKLEVCEIEDKIDGLVFELYGLKEYQKEIIREFYQIRVERFNDKVNEVDMKKYIEKFSHVFALMLQKGKSMIATYKISATVGTIVCFTIVDENKIHHPQEDKNLEILNFVKRKQIEKSDISKILNEDKVKIYDNQFMYIIKSNLFKDWTIRQASKDAREELGLIMSNLPNR
jgi:type I restriction-modification system DNA methylase subunit